MKAGILTLQLNPVLGDKNANLDKVEELISQNSGSGLDLVVIPEFFSTGVSQTSFINSPEDENGGKVIARIRKLAQKYNTNIVAGSVIVLSEGKRYNTSFAINRQGEIVAKYRKIHLYNFGGGTEDKYITPGDSKVVVDFDFAKVGMSICFDIKFPMLYRELIKLGAEIIVSPSAWITMTKFSDKIKDDFVRTWQSMNITRAAETLTYFVTSNLVGKVDDNLIAVGNSMITDPLGTVVAGADNYETGIYAEVDLSIVRDFKKLYPLAEME